MTDLELLHFEQLKSEVQAKYLENHTPSYDEISKWKGIEVVDGDLSDLRPKDKKKVIIGLKAKGLAKTIKTDFVIKTVNI